jgi:LemA protein
VSSLLGLGLFALALVALLAWWLLRAHKHLVRHRNEMVEAFGMLHEQLTRRHRQVHDLVFRAGEVAPGDDTVRVASTATTLEAARTVAAYAKASPADGRRMAVVDRAEVTLTHRLSRFMSSLVKSPPCREDEQLRRMRQDIVRTAVELHVATQCFNQAALAYNRAARQTPRRFVAKVSGFQDAMVVSPALANLLAPRGRRRGEAATETETVDAGEDTRFLDDSATTFFGVDFDPTRSVAQAQIRSRQARASR